MHSRLRLAIQRQPDNTTCGPTCLHAIYTYYGEQVALEQIIKETRKLDEGGTYAVLLGCHALAKGYDVEVYTWNLQVFDPTWFQLAPAAMRERLAKRRRLKTNHKLLGAIDAYLEFMDAGGEVRFEDLTTALIRKHLTKGVPILSGLSSTYLYRAMREYGAAMEDDDVRGEPQGHFVVLCGYDREDRTVLVADPLHPNLAYQGLQYVVEIDRLVCSILLGILTHDADLLIIRPKGHGRDDAADHAGEHAGGSRLSLSGGDRAEREDASEHRGRGDSTGEKGGGTAWRS
jgi:hypothetical protein